LISGLSALALTACSGSGTVHMVDSVAMP
jgi:hypothetical protein